MKNRSAGILVYRRKEGGSLEVFLVHPGGPLWAGKDEHAWSIPKGQLGPDEEPFAAALREFAEETGQTMKGEFIELAECRTPGGRVILTWAIEGDLDPADVVSNHFEMEWPPRSGERQQFPEVDRGEWFEVEIARRKIHQGQVPILGDLARRLEAAG
ncbi:MAG: Phosphohydrolase [Verrucomicrobia bacterium]|nr:Phosphohydrolase [Verrucomicrobiota bacterium]